MARSALDRGQAALAAGDHHDAIRWLDRAHRLIPSDGLVTLALGTACLARDNARAARLFSEIAETYGGREAWIGLAAARLQMTEHEGAARALHEALRQHTVGMGIDVLADAIVAASHNQGWCGVDTAGTVIVRAPPANRAEIRLDGRRIRGGALPKRWMQGRQLTVTANGCHLLGSPVDILSISRVAGCVEPTSNGLTGWAWCPGDPDTVPELVIKPLKGRRTLRIQATSCDVPDARTLQRLRGFLVTHDQLKGLRGPLRVIGRDGQDLTGSPIDPLLMRKASYFPADRRLPRKDGGHPGPVDIVVSIQGHARTALACLTSLLTTTREPDRVIVMTGTPSACEVTEALNSLAHGGRLILISHGSELDYLLPSGTGADGLQERDIVLLDGTIAVPPRWLDRLRTAAYSAPDIGTVAPFSNGTGIAGYSTPPGSVTASSLTDGLRLDQLAWRANGAAVIESPCNGGHCLFIKRRCLDTTGPFRTDIFGQGNGRENDFCLRAGQLGWRHVVLPGLFVANLDDGTIDQESSLRKARDERLLRQLFPGYDARIEAYLAAPSLMEARRRFDLEHWRTANGTAPTSVLLISHDQGGGVERRIEAAIQDITADNQRAVLLRPAPDVHGGDGVVVSDVTDRRLPPLRFALPHELPALFRFLRRLRPLRAEIHNLLDHSATLPKMIARLRIPYDVHVHDYAWFCPRISLSDANGRYCGEPSVMGCEACITRNGRLIREDIGVQALRARSTTFLTGARTVTAPSHDTAIRMGRYFATTHPIVVRSHQDDQAIPPVVRVPHPRGPIRICIVGTIGRHKGYDIVLHCARDASDRMLPLEFIVVGDTIDDDLLFATGRVFITGTYHPDEAVALIRSQNATLGFLPSLLPETWSLTLTEMWQAGLPVAAFDLGAQAERIRQTGRGLVLPLGLAPSAINNVLLATSSVSGHL